MAGEFLPRPLVDQPLVEKDLQAGGISCLEDGEFQPESREGFQEV